MTEIKYTKEGRKVAVIGKLNNEEWIVQEIFVANGKEFPAGENFTAKTLLDEPAETWQERNTKDKERRAEQINAEIDSLHEKHKIAKRDAEARRIINFCTSKHVLAGKEEVQQLIDFLAGKITHVITDGYDSPRIMTLQEAIELQDDYSARFDGLKLITLFGVNQHGERIHGESGVKLNWRLNQYRGGSGSSTEIHPCTSHEDAVKKMDEILANKKEARDEHVALKEKYGLKNPTQEKINALRKKQRESIIRKKKELETEIAKQDKLLADLKQ